MGGRLGNAAFLHGGMSGDVRAGSHYEELVSSLGISPYQGPIRKGQDLASSHRPSQELITRTGSPSLPLLSRTGT
jgi:hypothetical protein